MTAPQRPGRVLGVDPGTVRVGLAITDPDRTLATPHSTVKGGKGAAARICAVADELHCTALVVGLPIALSGRETDSTRMARTLADELRATGLEVHLQDERLTSRQADASLRASGRNSRTGKDVKDQVAASLLLQAWIDRTPT